MRAARELGELLACEGWVVATGGLGLGIMDAALRGAHEAGGLTLGILPTADDARGSEWARIRVRTGMGDARNVILVLTSDALVACGMSAGTASEAALALGSGKPLVFLRPSDACLTFYQPMCDAPLVVVDTPRAAVDALRRVLGLTIESATDLQGSETGKPLDQWQATPPD